MTKHEWKKSWSNVRYFRKYNDTDLNRSDLLAFNTLIGRYSVDQLGNKSRLFKDLYEYILPF